MSEQEAMPVPSYDEPQQKKSSNSGCLKIVLILGGLGAFCMLLCCGGIAYVGSTFAPKETSVPAEVAAVGQQIMKIDIPEGFVGKQAVSVDNFAMTMQMAKFQRPEGNARLHLQKIAIKFAGEMNAQQEKELKGKLPNQIDAEDMNLQTQKTEAREFMIGGQPVTFNFSEATESGTNTAYRVVEGQMGSGTNIRSLKFVVTDEAYDEEEVVKMIESIQ